MTESSTSSINTRKLTLLLQIYFFIVIIGGIITLGSLLQIPAEAQNTGIFGLSRERILMSAGILIVILASTGILISSWLNTPIFTRFAQRLTKIIKHRSFYGWSILVCSVVLFSSTDLISLTPEITEPFTQALFIRLQPFFTWAAALSVQTLLALVLIHFGFNLQALKPQHRIFYQIAGIFTLLLLFWFLIAQTRIGLTASDAGAGWNALGTPVLETQAFAAWMIGLIYIGLALLGEKHPAIIDRARQYRFLRIDLVVSIILWVAAFAIWNSIPLTANWFAAPTRVPNQAIYPNSDAYLYDTTGQTLLTGEGFKTENAPFAIRPLYALFLAGLHSLGGPDYETITWLQVAVLALIPVLLYWITRNIHNRVSGLIAATLLIFREANAIILGSSITTSHSKLLMADLPTTLGVMLLVLLMIRWLQNPAQRLTLALISGGLTGAFMLIRPEFAVLLPFLGLTAFLQLLMVFPRSFLAIQGDTPSSNTTQKMGAKIWIKGMLLTMIGLILFLLPWIWRNYQITGTIYLDSPHYRSDLFALRYQEYAPDENSNTEKNPESTTTPDSQPTDTSSQTSELVTTTPTTPTPQIAYQPGENAESFANRMFGNVLKYATNNLTAVLHFITNHFVNSQVQSILYLPATIRMPDSIVAFIGHKDPQKFWVQCCSAENYIRRLPFWFKWDGNLPSQSILLLGINLSLISIGLASSWKKSKFIALLPLFASMGYALINALVRNSGGRYILPVDWVGIFYFSIGLGQLTLWLVTYFRGSELPSRLVGEIKNQINENESPVWRRSNPAVATLILLLGSLLPISEKIIPPHYAFELQADRQNQLTQYLDIPLEIILNQGGSVVHGRALYPRFHDAGQGEAGTRRTPFSPLPFSRLDFYMVGPFNGGVVLALDSSPEKFPNGADVLVAGCPGEEYFDAIVVMVYDPAGNLDQILFRQPFPENLFCPLPSPDSDSDP